MPINGVTQKFHYLKINLTNKFITFHSKKEIKSENKKTMNKIKLLQKNLEIFLKIPTMTIIYCINETHLLTCISVYPK
jgi:hypothetical protein